MQILVTKKVTLPENFGGYLKGICDRDGRPLKRIAEEAGISRSTFYNILGEQVPIVEAKKLIDLRVVLNHNLGIKDEDLTIGKTDGSQA